MKILRTKSFSNSDEKLIKKIAKTEEGLDDTIHQYKQALKNKDLSDKERKNIGGLLQAAKNVKNNPDSFVELKFRDKGPKIKKGGFLHKAELDMVEGKNGKERNILSAAHSLGMGGIGYGIGRAAGWDRSTSAKLGAAGVAGSLVGTAINRAIINPTVRNNQNSSIVKRDKDSIKVRTGEMSKREFVKKWGGKINGKKVKGSEEE